MTRGWLPPSGALPTPSACGVSRGGGAGICSCCLGLLGRSLGEEAEVNPGRASLLWTALAWSVRGCTGDRLRRWL